MNANFKFSSKLSADILGEGATQALLSSLNTNGRDVGAIQSLSSGTLDTSKFGASVFVSQARLLEVGMAFVIIDLVHVPASKDARGNTIQAYDAIGIRNSKGEHSVIALSTLFNPWNPVVTDKNAIIPLGEHSEAFRNQFTEESYDKLAKFVKKNNTEENFNSFVNGFERKSFEQRLEAMNGAVITITDSVSVQVNLTLTDRGAGMGMGDAGKIIPATIRNYAFSVDADAKALTAFSKSIKEATKK